jgi:hypothetical protein
MDATRRRSMLAVALSLPLHGARLAVMLALSKGGVPQVAAIVPVEVEIVRSETSTIPACSAIGHERRAGDVPG